MGNEHTKSDSDYKRISGTAIHDSSYLISSCTNTYPDAMEYTIYGFIREFIEQNLWIEWSKHKVIPHEIKIMLTKYLKSELIVQEGTKITLSSDVYHEFEHILIKKNGILTVQPWNPKRNKGGKLLLKIQHNLTIKENGQINVDGKGYYGGYFCEQGESYNGKGSKNNIDNNGGGGGAGKSPKSGYSKCRGAGGGYGTKGKDINNGKYKSAGGQIYGDEYLTFLYLGSGGGGGYNNGISENESGGNGGGVIDIQCHGDITMEQLAKISANGNNSIYGGGGSGGSIKISCNKILFHNTTDSYIQGNGGLDKDKHRAGCGRIRISTKDKLFDPGRRISPIPFVDTSMVENYVE